MFLPRRLVGLLTLGICSATLACSHKQSPQLDPESLLNVAREYGRNGQPVSVVSAAGRPAGETAPVASPAAAETEEQYVHDIRERLNEWDWDGLEKAVQEARTSKARVLGGGWKLYMFYEAVGAPVSEHKITDTDWANHLEVLKQWATAKPESSAALIATAWAYVAYGGFARCSGYADTVTATGWKLYGERAAKASEFLVEAARLNEKCPFWYEAMQHVAHEQGWEKPQARELFDLALAYLPGYYHFYREYANYLLPKWYGEEGDVQAFAEETAARVGPPEGDIFYFDIGSTVACECDPDRNSLEGLSWPRLKQGYATLGELYGISDLKANRFALMAYLEKDQPAAQAAFEKIGPHWEPTVWTSKQDFDKAKSWATHP